MRSKTGLLASIVFLLAVPIAAVYQAVVGIGVGAVIHGAFALGAGLMAVAVFDFRTPRWATWVGAVSTGVLAVVFFLQGLTELTHDEALARLAYDVMGQRLEGWLVALFMAWCVAALATGDPGRTRIVGIVAMGTVAGVRSGSGLSGHLIGCAGAATEGSVAHAVRLDPV